MLSALRVLLELCICVCRLCWAWLKWLASWVITPPRKALTGKVVLITGAAGGIGRALARRFALHGCLLALVDINKDGLVEVADSLKEVCRELRTYQCDITKRNLVASMADDIRRDFGHVDILVNNAGILIANHVTDVSESEARRTIDINLMAPLWLIKEFLPDMKERRSGHVVNVASMLGKIALGMQVEYCASKYGVVGLTESLYMDLQLSGHPEVNVSVVCPFFVDTNLVRDLNEGKTRVVSRFERIITPEEVSKALVRGVQEEEFLICVPRHMWWYCLVSCLFTREMGNILEKFMETGYRHTPQNNNKY